MRHAGNQLTDRGHFLRLQKLILEPALLRLVFEQQDGGARLPGANGGDDEHAVAGSHFDGCAVRRRHQATDLIDPGSGQQGDPGSARQRGHRQLDQVGEDAIGAPHGPLGIDEADGLVDRVHGLLPLPLATREELDQPGVFERDGGLREHGTDEGERGLAERPGVMTFERHGADGAAHCRDRRPQPARGLGRGYRDAEVGGTRSDVVGQDERSAAQSELQQGLVGIRRAGTVVVGDDEMV